MIIDFNKNRALKDAIMQTFVETASVESLNRIAELYEVNIHNLESENQDHSMLSRVGENNFNKLNDIIELRIEVHKC